MKQFLVQAADDGDDGESVLATASRHGRRAAHDVARRFSWRYRTTALVHGARPAMAEAVYDRGRAVTAKRLLRELAAAYRAAKRGGYAFDCAACPF